MRHTLCLGALLLLAGCADEVGQTCAPGSTQTCLCVGGASGVQECNQAGSGWDKCVCTTTPDAGVDGPRNDGPRPDREGKDLALPDKAKIDGLVSDTTKPDAPQPDIPVPDFPAPDLPVPDLPVPDQTTPDLAQPDQVVADLAVPDQAVADLAVPDQQVPDFPSPDFSLPDLGPPLKPVLLSGGIGGLGPVSAGSYVLLEGGFTWGEASCVSSAGLCLSGDISP